MGEGRGGGAVGFRDPAATRREFLSKQGAAAVVSALGLNAPGAPEAPAQSELVLTSRAAMACRFEVMLPDPASVTAAGDALAIIDSLEQQMSVFRPGSELCEINRRACDGPVPVEEGLFSLLETCARLWAGTRGAFDAAQGALSALWRSCRKEARVPSAAEIEAATRAGGMQHVVLDPARKTVRLTCPGAALDLGAIGKGYAVDRICQRLRAHGVHAALVHAGHSSIFAMGRPAPGQDWLVAIGNPAGGEAPIAQVRLRDQAMATSGSSEQVFRIDGKEYGHIIDPRTGWPAQGILSATAIAPTAAEADALSTSFYVMGLEQAAAYCERHPQVAALVVCQDEQSGQLRVANLGIRGDALEVLA